MEKSKNVYKKDIHNKNAQNQRGCQLYTKLYTLYTFRNLEKGQVFWRIFEQTFCEDVIKIKISRKRLEFVEERKK